MEMAVDFLTIEFSKTQQRTLLRESPDPNPVKNDSEHLFNIFFLNCRILRFWILRNLGFGPFKPRNRFQEIDSASLCSLAGRYDNPIPSFPPPDCSKVPSLDSAMDWRIINLCWRRGEWVGRGRLGSPARREREVLLVPSVRWTVSCNGGKSIDNAPLL